MNRRRKIAVLGAFGGVNIGDEMILRAVLSGLSIEKADKPVIVCGLRPDGSAWESDYAAHGAVLRSWRKPVAAARSVFGRDLFIGGGQLIDGSAGIQNPLVQLGLALAAKAGGGRVRVAGVGAVPIQEPGIARAYAALFRVADRIMPRDEDSARSIREMAPASARKIETTADVVFAMKDQIGPGLALDQRKTIGFAVHHSPHRPLTQLDDACAAIDRILTVLPDGFGVELLAHDRRPEFDLQFSRSIADRIDDRRLGVRTFENTQDCIEAYRSLRSIVSVRMHPIIIGACAGCALVPLAGSGKQEALAKRLGIGLTDLGDIQAMPQDQLAKLLSIGGDGQRPASETMMTLQQQAARNFEPFDIGVRK